MRGRVMTRRDVSDYGPAARWQHDDMALTETERAGVKRAYVVTQSPIDRFLARRLLGDPQTGKRRHEAGNRLYALFYRAGLSNQVTGSYSVRLSGGGVEGYRVLCLDAYRDYLDACRAMSRAAALVTYSVCCCHETPGSPARMVLLRLGLDELVRHWRM